MENSSNFFQNTGCKYFPCHSGVEPEQFNCLFCYCPLYALGRGCGGNFRILESGVKSCVGCAVPHGPDGYRRVMEKMPELIRQVKDRCRQAENEL